MLEPVALPKNIYDEAVRNKVAQIQLHFSGGNDEGYLNVDLLRHESDPVVGIFVRADDLEKMVEDWAWKVYEYSGAGDGNDYGDDITYDLVAKKVTSCEWCMERTDGDDNELELVIDEGQDDKAQDD